MDERKPSTFKRPWNSPARIVAWFLLLMVASFGVICAIALLTDSNVGNPDLVPFAAIVSIAIAIGGLVLFWFVRWFRSGRNFRRFAFVVACLVTLILLAYAEENWRGKRAWGKYRRHWEAQGEKFNLAAFVPPPVPDEQNFANTPLLKPLLEFTRDSGVVWRDTNALPRINRISAQLTGKGKKQNFDMGSVQKGTLADLNDIAEFYRGNTNYPQASADARPADVILVALGKFDSEMKELREAVATRPYSRFAIDYGFQPPSAILLPHLAPVKGLTVLCYVRAVAELEAGRSSEAFTDLKLALRLSDSIRDEPILIDHLVRLATLGISLQGIREGLARHAWTEAQLGEIESYLGSANLLTEYKRCMRGERALGIEGVDYLRGAGRRNMEGALPEDGGGSLTTVPRLIPGGWFYQNSVTISRMYQDFLLPAVDEQTHRVFPEISEKGSGVLVQMRAGPYTIFAKLLLPALEKAVVKSARMQTCADAARLACALERYRLAKGNLPASLEALVPSFIDRIPNDVIDGKPLRYRLESNGDYVLYSIGWNGVDDRGELAWLRENKGAPAERKDENRPFHGDLDDTKGDWTWSSSGRNPESTP